MKQLAAQQYGVRNIKLISAALLLTVATLSYGEARYISNP